MERHSVVHYYENPVVAQQLVTNATNREVAGALFTGAYEKRPNILQYPSDVSQMVRRGVTSFHYSVERWRYPMQLVRENYDELRTGWDMIFDIDSKMGMDEAKVAALLICDFLKKYGIRNYGVKFSGSRGFHICLPWAMFPKDVDYTPLAVRYPEIPRILAAFVRRGIKKELLDVLIKMKGSVKELLAVLDQQPAEVNPFYFVDVEKNWGVRHMFRAPFSLNEKKWLCSLPLTRPELTSFTIRDAHPLYVLKRCEKNDFPAFFAGEENEALQLLTDALDWHATTKKEEPKKAMKPKITVWENKIPQELFPPCVRLILNGLADGRKRSMFTLVHFLRRMNWPWPDVETAIYEWNGRNKPSLPNSIVAAHLRWASQNQLTPANCANESFYKSIGICQPDETCRDGTQRIVIKNPIAYPFKKTRTTARQALQKSAQKTKQSRTYLTAYKCMRCERGFKSEKSLAIHRGRAHGIYD